MSGTAWRAKGLLFENCNCQLVCPGHISFKRVCTHERCIGAWAIHIEEGRYGDVVLDGLNIAVFWDSPQHMITGGRMYMEGLFDMAVEAIRGKDKTREALLENLFNQIHAPTQVLALGQTRLADPEFPFEMSGTHALYSRFSWEAA